MGGFVILRTCKGLIWTPLQFVISFAKIINIVYVWWFTVLKKTEMWDILVVFCFKWQVVKCIE